MRLIRTVYQNMGHTAPLEWASTLLGCLAVIFITPIYIFYWNGPKLRKKSKFAMILMADRKRAAEKSGRRPSQCGTGDPGPEEHYLESAAGSA